MNPFILMLAAVLVAFAAFLLLRRSALWPRIVAFFKDSETIFWARLQMAGGLAAGILTYVDPAILGGIFPEGWMPWVILANGIATEWLRRRREEAM